MLKRAAAYSFVLGCVVLASTGTMAQPYYGAPGYGWEDYRPRQRSWSEEYYSGPRYAPEPRRRDRGGSWDCNEHRCIDLSTGALWESTCDYYGCAPLRPARRNPSYQPW